MKLPYPITIHARTALPRQTGIDPDPLNESGCNDPGSWFPGDHRGPFDGPISWPADPEAYRRGIDRRYFYICDKCSHSVYGLATHTSENISAYYT